MEGKVFEDRGMNLRAIIAKRLVTISHIAIEP